MEKHIKDGIDVRQCECYSKEYNSCNDTLSGSCIKEKCQIFRLLQTIKTKEQECEELKLDLIEVKAHSDYLNNLALSETLNLVSEQLDQLEEQIKYQQNFIDSLLLATNNSEWLDKSILDDEASEIIEKIGMDYIEFEEGREINAELKAESEKLKQTLTEIKEIAEKAKKDICNNCGWRNTDSCDAEDYTCGEFIKILQKIREVVE